MTPILHKNSDILTCVCDNNILLVTKFVRFAWKIPEWYLQLTCYGCYSLISFNFIGTKEELIKFLGTKDDMELLK